MESTPSAPFCFAGLLRVKFQSFHFATKQMSFPSQYLDCCIAEPKVTEPKAQHQKTMAEKKYFKAPFVNNALHVNDALQENKVIVISQPKSQSKDVLDKISDALMYATHPSITTEELERQFGIFCNTDDPKISPYIFSAQHIVGQLKLTYEPFSPIWNTLDKLEKTMMIPVNPQSTAMTRKLFLDYKSRHPENSVFFSVSTGESWCNGYEWTVPSNCRHIFKTKKRGVIQYSLIEEGSQSSAVYCFFKPDIDRIIQEMMLLTDKVRGASEFIKELQLMHEEAFNWHDLLNANHGKILGIQFTTSDGMQHTIIPS